jgi:hypothetical protein
VGTPFIERYLTVFDECAQAEIIRIEAAARSKSPAGGH